MIDQDFYIIGIGASVGGYDALKEFFARIPEKPGVAFVILQHLDHPPAQLPQDGLATYCNMPLLTINQDTEVKPNHVYLMPADKTLIMQGRRLVVLPREQKPETQRAIDTFFQSLGQQVKTKAVGVLLAGTGTDGSEGIISIKENGGIVVVQQPEAAVSDGIPKTALPSVYPDLVLPADQLADGLLHYIRTPHLQFRHVLIQQDDQSFYADIDFTEVPASPEKQKLVMAHITKLADTAGANTAPEASALPAAFGESGELELAFTKKELHNTAEELERTTRALEAKNEELRSTNEEMQSLNEELHTVNVELQDKRKEASLLHNDVNNLINNTEISIIFLNEDLCMRRFSTAAKANFNFQETDLGRPLTHLPQNFRYHQFEEDTRHVLETHCSIEKEIEDTDGNYYVVHLLPYKTDRQLVKGVVITIIDITQLKVVSNNLLLRSNELQESDRSCRSLVNNSPDIIARYDKNLIYTYTNTALEKHLNLDATEIMGRHNTELSIPDDQEEKARWINYVEEAIATKKSAHTYFRYTAGPSEKHFYSSFVPEFYQETEEVQSVLTISRDVTELVQHETLIKEQNQELIKISNDLDNFVYTASHDLKAPILNIEGITTVLSEQLSEKAGKTEGMLLDMIGTSVDKFKHIISDLINISKAQHNFEAKAENISFKQALQEVQEEIHSTISETEATIHTDFQVNEVKYARYHLHSILLNLLTNALKYRSKRPLKIDLRTYQEGDTVVLEIEDNGLGLEASHLPDLFKMFKRFHDHVEGSGVGLYIVKRIVENNGGKIEAESEVNRGTTFRVIL